MTSRMQRWGALTIAAITLAVSGCSWTQYGGSAARRNYDSTSEQINPANIGQLVTRMTTTGSTGAPLIVGTQTFTFSNGVNAIIEVYPTVPDNTCTGTVCPPSVRLDFGSARIGQPAVVNGTLFVASESGGVTSLRAFTTAGLSCPTGTPAQNCATWYAQAGDGLGSDGRAPQLAVADGQVYVETGGKYSGLGGPAIQSTTVTVFDAAGANACNPAAPSGCTHKFQFATDIPSYSAPTVADHRVFVSSSNGAWMFDSDGTRSCSAGVCTPLARLAMPGGQPTGIVASKGRAYGTGLAGLAAFDSAGNANCAGQPIVCRPVWTAPLRSYGGGLVVTDTRVFVNESNNGGIEVFDAGGTQGCAGQPVICTRLWGIPASQMPGNINSMAASAFILVVAGSTADITGNASPNVRFFDLAGTTGCNSAPVECNALRTIALPPSQFVFLDGPAIAFGRIAIGSNNVGRTGTTTVFGLPG